MNRSAPAAPAVLLAATLLGSCGDDPVVVCPAIYPWQILVSPVADTVPAGDAVTFTARRGGPPGRVQGACEDFYGDPPSSRVTWSLSDPKIADIASFSDSTVVVRGTRAGRTTVVASSRSVPTVAAAAALEVQSRAAGAATSRRKLP